MNVNVPEYLYAKLRQARMTAEGACAVLGNVQAESAFIPNNVEDRSGIPDAVYTQQVDSGARTKDQFVHDTYGYGLAQWTYFTRKAEMWEYFKKRGRSIGDLETQVDFLIFEMKAMYRSCWNLCCSSNDLYECTKKLLYEWENPAEKENNMSLRFSNAQKWYSKLSGQSYDEAEVPETPSVVEVDDDGIRIEKTWPPRTLDMHCEDFKEIKLLEALLGCHGYNVIVEGIFGESLDKKVRQYQQENHLLADGIVGPNTWKSLLKVPDRW